MPWLAGGLQGWVKGRGEQKGEGSTGAKNGEAITSQLQANRAIAVLPTLS